MGAYRGPIPDAPVWVHAVSVGEVGVAATLLKALPRELPLVVTTITPTGQSRAQASLGQRAAVTYFPFESDIAIGRFLRRFRPRLLILVEGDLWPLVLARVKRRGLAIAVVNGRISDRSFRRMRRLRRFLGPLLAPVDRFGVQTQADRRRLLDLGVAAHKITHTGNLKFETPAPEAKPELERQILDLGQERPILCAGSTMPGEEEQVLEAFLALGGGSRALLVLAPRHPERWNEVERLLQDRRLEYCRRSLMPTESRRPSVLLLDSLGELAALYRIGRGAFIGGTLVPTGGHNPLEAAQYGVPTVVGPSMENFREIAEHFDRANAWQRVADSGELAAVWQGWLDNAAEASELGSRGARIIEDNQGALARTVELLGPLLSPGTDADP
jgi:3-deoxy-D-manno-octulosonic-acid transferase